MTAYNAKKRVYIVERSVYSSNFELQARYEPCEIYAIGIGVSEAHWISQQKRDATMYHLCSNWDSEKPSSKYMFITKVKRV